MLIVRLYQLRQPITTVSVKNSWDTSTQLAVFFYISLWLISLSSQCGLSQVTHQILHTNIGRAQRQQSVPTILTETAGENTAR